MKELKEEKMNNRRDVKELGEGRVCYLYLPELSLSLVALCCTHCFSHSQHKISTSLPIRKSPNAKIIFLTNKVFPTLNVVTFLCMVSASIDSSSCGTKGQRLFVVSSSLGMWTRTFQVLQ